MLETREHFALVSLSGRIFAVGGLEINHLALNSVECYDPFRNRWEFFGPMNRKRYGHSVAIHKNCLFAIGGYYETSVDDSVEFYDQTIDKWTMVLTINNQICREHIIIILFNVQYFSHNKFL